MTNLQNLTTGGENERLNIIKIYTMRDRLQEVGTEEAMQLRRNMMDGLTKGVYSPDIYQGRFDKIINGAKAIKSTERI